MLLPVGTPMIGLPVVPFSQQPVTCLGVMDNTYTSSLCNSGTLYLVYMKWVDN